MANFFQRRSARKELHRFRSSVRNLRHNDDDLLDDRQKAGLEELLAAAATVPPEPEAIHEFLARGRERVRRLVAAPSHPRIREWLDIIVVAMAVAFGIRGLYVQPFKIPTGSMQPTLYGIHFIEREGRSNPLLGRVTPPLDYLLFTARRARLEVEAPGGRFHPESRRRTGNALFDSLSFRIGDREYTLPGAPEKVLEYSNLELGRNYTGGEVLCDGYLSLGDHLFVDRMSHYLTGLRRGDVVVFSTEGIEVNGHQLSELSGYYYIKRLVGLPGDTLKIEDDQLWIRPRGETEFRKVQELAPKLAKLYSGEGGYQGHSNWMDGRPGPFLGLPGAEFTVPEDSYFMLGDNTRFSLDSRAWGVVPRRNIVGRAWLVFWPFSRRWGLADRAGAYPVPTGEPKRGTFPSMYLQ